MKHLLNIIFVCLLSGTAWAQTDFFSKAEGRWVGEGQLFGHEAQFIMQWTYVLDSTFARLDFTNQIKGAKVQFTAVGYYPLKGQDDGSWMDNRGVSQSLTLTFDGDEMTVIWVSSAEKGKTAYTFDGQDIMSVEDYVFKNNEWKSFGSAQYVKKEVLNE